jgi:hypothetical protein
MRDVVLFTPELWERVISVELGRDRLGFNNREGFQDYVSDHPYSSLANLSASSNCYRFPPNDGFPSHHESNGEFEQVFRPDIHLGFITNLRFGRNRVWCSSVGDRHSKSRISKPLPIALL